MGKKGRRSSKGIPETNWGQPKTKRFTVQLTEEGHTALKARAENLEISISEVFERWARGMLVDELGTAPQKEQSNLSEPALIPINADSVLSALPHFSRYQIGRIGLACLSLLMVSFRTGAGNTMSIAQLVREYQEVVIAIFTDVIRNPQQRVNQIIEGDKPTKEELGLLVGALPITYEELIDLYKKEFGCGDESGQGCVHGC